MIYEIILRISELDGRDPDELPPIRDSIDVDALKTIVESGADQVEFTHLDYVVSIRDGEISVREQDD